MEDYIDQLINRINLLEQMNQSLSTWHKYQIEGLVDKINQLEQDLANITSMLYYIESHQKIKRRK